MNWKLEKKCSLVEIKLRRGKQEEEYANTKHAGVFHLTELNQRLSAYFPFKFDGYLAS